MSSALFSTCSLVYIDLIVLHTEVAVCFFDEAEYLSATRLSVLLHT